MINSMAFFQKKVTNTFNKIKPSKKEPGFIFGKDNAYSVSIAKTLNDYKQCYQLVYESYLEKGLANTDSEKMWYSIYNANPDTVTIQIKKDQQVIGTLTLINDSPLGLPADNLYKKELYHIRKKYQKTSEVISFAIDSKHRSNRKLFLKLTEFVIFISKEIVGADVLLTTVHPNHGEYYQNRLLFKKLSDEKEYKKVGGAPAILYGLDFKELESEISKCHAHIKTKSSYRLHSLYLTRQTSINKIKKQMQSISLPLFIYFFIKKKNLLTKANQQQVDFLRLHYRRKLIRFDPAISL